MWRVRKITQSDYELRQVCCLSVRMEKLGSNWLEFHEI